jgi:hypothetical protein
MKSIASKGTSQMNPILAISLLGQAIDTTGRNGSTQADRYLRKLRHLTGRINGAGGHLILAADVCPGSAEFATLIRKRAPRIRLTLFGQPRSLHAENLVA